jgi:hypothetical protein
VCLVIFLSGAMLKHTVKLNGSQTTTICNLLPLVSVSVSFAKAAVNRFGSNVLIAFAFGCLLVWCWVFTA